MIMLEIPILLELVILLKITQKNIDWEQRRYEIAKDAMCAVIQIQSTKVAAVSNNMSFEKYSAMTAIYCADALIEELKNGI